MSQFTSSQLGDLLSASGLVKRENIDGALSMSGTRRQPLGKILIESGLMTETELLGTLQAQNLIREKLLESDAALQLLSKVRQSGKSFVDCLLESSYRVEALDFGIALGRLLIDAGAISEEALREALDTSIVSGLPLARVLILHRDLSEQTAYAGLTAMLLVKEGHIARGEAVGALKLSHMHGENIEEILEFGGFKKFRDGNIVRLGELLVLAELISEIDLLTCVERSLALAMPLGQVLVDEGIMAEELVQSALRAQKYIEQGTVDALRAAQMLKYCARTGQLLEFSLEELASIKPRQFFEERPADQVELLELLGLISNTDLDQIKLVKQEALDLQKVEDFIIEKGILSPEALAALRLGLDMVHSEKISLEQLVFAMHVWLWERGDFAKLVKNLGW